MLELLLGSLLELLLDHLLDLLLDHLLVVGVKIVFFGSCALEEVRNDDFCRRCVFVDVRHFARNFA